MPDAVYLQQWVETKQYCFVEQIVNTIGTT